LPGVLRLLRVTILAKKLWQFQTTLKTWLILKGKLAEERQALMMEQQNELFEKLQTLQK